MAALIIVIITLAVLLSRGGLYGLISLLIRLGNYKVITKYLVIAKYIYSCDDGDLVQ